MRQLGSEAGLGAQLRDGDELAFTEIVQRYHAQLIRPPARATLVTTDRIDIDELSPDMRDALVACYRNTMDRHQ